MTENTLLYTYCVKVCERYDLTYEEMHALVGQELGTASGNKNIILTAKGDNGRDFFKAFACKKITGDFVWIHCCSRKILGFSDEDDLKKYYMLVFTAHSKNGLYV